jgi:hypothetical protein
MKGDALITEEYFNREMLWLGKEHTAECIPMYVQFGVGVG